MSDAARTATGGRARMLGWLGLGMALLAHLWLVGRFAQLERVLEDLPYAYGDYSLHFADAVAGRDRLDRTGSLWAWSPWQLAGYPAGVFDAVSNRPAELLLWLWRFAAPAVTFKLWVAFTLLAPPLLVGLAARLGGFEPPVPALTVLLALGYQHLDARLFTLVRRGLFEFPFAVAFGLVAVGAAAAWTRRPSATRAAASGLALGLGWLAHPTLPVLWATPLVLLAASAPRPLRLLRTAPLAAALALLPNLPWLLPTLRHLSRLGPDSGFWATTGRSLLGDAVAGVGAAPRQALVAAALLALAVPGRGRRLPWVAAAMVALLLGYHGSELALVRRLEPARFAAASGYFALLPAADLAARALAPGRRRALALLGLALAVGLLPFAGQRPSAWLPPYLRFTLPLEERPEAGQLVALLDRVSDRGGRILLDQDWPGRNLHGFIGSYVGLHLEREILGGPHPWVKTIENAANPFQGWFLGRRLADLDDPDLAALLGLYNVRWLASRDVGLGARLERSAVVEPAGRAGAWRVFRVVAPGDFFLAGSGQVTAGLDRIELRRLAPGSTVLRYHWHPRFRARPAVPVRPFPVAGAAAPFLAVDNGGVTDLVLTVDRSLAWR